MSQTSLRILGFLLIIFEIWLAFMYGFVYYYNSATNALALDLSGIFIAVCTAILILVGFGLLTTYIQNFSVTGMILTFFILAFSIQYYFIVWSFWVKTGLTQQDNIGSFNQQDFFTLGLSARNDRAITSNIMTSSIHQAMAMGLALIVATFAVLGRTGPLEAFLLVAVGGFFYAFNEAVFWRISVADAGYCGRIFLFGSSLGIISSLILGKKDLTNDNRNYLSTKSYQTLALVGAIFIWVFIPVLTTFNQFGKADPNVPTVPNSGVPGGFSINPRVSYAQTGPFNIFLALSASTIAAFCVSMAVNRKISVHDIVFSSFAGAVAFGAASDINTNTFPPILVGFTAGAISALLNSLAKKKMNRNGVIDSQGVLFSFFVPGVIGSCYSAIIAAIDTQSPGGNGISLLVSDRNNNGQGGIQMAGMGIAIFVGAFAGVIVGILYKISNVAFVTNVDEFNDETFVKFDHEGVPEQRDQFIAQQPQFVANQQQHDAMQQPHGMQPQKHSTIELKSSALPPRQ